MEIDVVYVIKDGNTNGWELPYSIRLAAKNLIGMRKLVIVTRDLPPFLDADKVIHVVETDAEHVKDACIMRKILAACHDGRVSDEFLFINDDHFVIAPTDAVSYPYYYKGKLPRPDNKTFNTYQRRLQATCAALRKAGKGSLHYDIHTPIRYEKGRFVAAAEAFNYRYGLGMVVKSLYGNYWNVGGEFLEDCKLDHPMRRDEILKRIKGRHVFSTSDNSFSRALRKILEDAGGGTPCFWEKDFDDDFDPPSDAAESIAAREGGSPVVNGITERFHNRAADPPCH